MKRFALLIALMWAPLNASASAMLTGRAEIVDADTIKVGGIPVRLAGIDAPEGNQTCSAADGKSYACGRFAIRVLSELVANQPVECVVSSRDEFGRALGVCTANGVELNAAMVRKGWALAFTKYSDTYVGDEKAAEAGKLGMWAGVFAKPWDWRLAKTQAVEQTRECVIKGNINRQGERIYHLPFQQFYGRTDIDPGNGERWFCTEGEALSAGWRRSLR